MIYLKFITGVKFIFLVNVKNKVEYNYIIERRRIKCKSK